MANSMPLDSQEDHLLDEDYYAFLNLNKDATTEDITNAYRRLSRLYHPDKHTDPVQKKNAEVLFNKTKIAYEVLSDPHQRAIYDTLGIKGLQTEGWQIVERTKTPQEIREEYEQLLREKEERRIQQRTNPKDLIYFLSFGTVQTAFHFMGSGVSPGFEMMLARQLARNTAGYLTVKSGPSSSVNTMIAHDTEKYHFTVGIQFGIQRSFFTVSYTRKLEDEGRLKGSVKFGVFGAILEYGCQKKISKNSTVGATMVIGVPSGVTLKLKFNRANQTFLFPIMLSEELIPSAVFYGTAAPILGWYILKMVYIDPYNERQKRRETEKMKEVNAQRMAERKKEASIAVSLMQETYRRIKTEEEKKNGLVIKLAVYGSAENISNLNLDQLDSQLDVLDVTVQLQCLVKDSKLILPNRSKSNLPGFYDPCLGEEKLLRVEYLFRNKTHSITISDNEMLRIPRITDS
ncbi:dnaJ homolog subfamily C member 11 [Trichonephila inaurata madagascariensis]|uniref:DnaJ homolog subfamily C member 11 n=1 Tax=Trichonephila inaurata madagascariensis TaxID=2747483 RepID=A0A8X6X7Y3_9ARAC|nr:dnaJ homolog subfamily C member 11 [Trichonephila inaurata madagascariensis]